jgi:outer membrane biosynthesis protein TonB
LLRRLLIPAIVVLTVAAMVLAAYFVMGMGKKDQARKAPKITLLTPPPPPPPPPPPKFEKKPDPPKEQKEMKVEQQPVPKQDAPPPSPELKMDGPAGNGPSAFAAGKITSEDLSKVGIGKPGGTGSGDRTGMFNPFTNYLNVAKGELSRFLQSKTRNMRQNKRYMVEVHLWVMPTGSVSRYELVGGTGDDGTDELIRSALVDLPGFSQALPPNMEQPIRLRVRIGT